MLVYLLPLLDVLLEAEGLSLRERIGFWRYLTKAAAILAVVAFAVILILER